MTTTSMLMCQTRSINDHDLQVLRDFALEAPWNWRVLFETLLEELEEARERENVEQEFDDLTDTVAEARLKLAGISAELAGIVPIAGDAEAAQMPWMTRVSTNGGPVKTLRERLTDLQETLDEVVEGLEPEAVNAVPAKPVSPTGGTP